MSHNTLLPTPFLIQTKILNAYEYVQQTWVWMFQTFTEQQTNRMISAWS